MVKESFPEACATSLPEGQHLCSLSHRQPQKQVLGPWVGRPMVYALFAHTRVLRKASENRRDLFKRASHGRRNDLCRGARGISGTFCEKCYLGICSHGDGSGANSREREETVIGREEVSCTP